MMERRGLVAFLLGSSALLAGWRTANAATGNGKPHRLAMHIDSNDAAIMNLGLNNASNVVGYYKEHGASAAVEIVAYGPGLHMLRDDTSPVKDRLMRLTKDGAFPSQLQFSACHNTMMGMEKREGHPIPIVQGAKIVPAGVVRITELQEEGWTYLRP